MAETAFEKFLPVTLEKGEEQTTAMMIVVDTSSSMQGLNHQMAIQGTMQCIETLADTDYVLLEFSTRISYKDLFGYVKAISGKHYRPIIAHAERYGCLYRKEELIKELIGAGAYIQMNTESLPGGSFNRQAAYCRSLLEKGYVHFLGTDCHDTQMRKPQMQTDLSKIKYARYDEQINKIMLHNIDCLLANKWI